MEIQEAIDAIRALPAPDYGYQEDRRRAIEAAHNEHQRLGAVLQSYIVRRFNRGLRGIGYSESAGKGGYYIDHAARHTHPYVNVRVTLLVGGKGSSTRCEFHLTYEPQSDGDLRAWCETWIKWIRKAPLGTDGVKP